MDHVLHPLLFFIMCMMTISYAQDFDLQNPDFEIPPSDTASNSSTSQSLLLNSIPGWSLGGTVFYVTSGRNLSFPDDNGGAHAVQLGENGTINQTLEAKGEESGYVLTFNLIPQSEDCANNRTSVNVSVDGIPYSERSAIFSLQRNLTRNLWERHAFFLGRLGNESVNIQITSVKTTNYSQTNNVACWPLVDAFTVKKNSFPTLYEAIKTIGNGGFEIGPAFLKNSAEGIILDEEDVYNDDSPLEDWSILGKIKYIDSEHYKVPQGKAAIELVSSGDPSGVQIDVHLRTGYRYTLNFTMGDGNNSCAGDFIVHLQIGNNVVHNFTMRSNGTGSAFKRSITFKDKFSSTFDTFIALYSYNRTRTSYGVLCGPVLDDITLEGYDEGRTSYGERMNVCDGVSIVSLFTALVMLMML